MTGYLFIESNTTGTGGLAVDRLLAAGHEVVFLTRAPEKYPFLASPASGLEVVEVETNDSDVLLDAVRSCVSRYSSVVVLTFSEFYVEITARIARRLGLRYLDPRAAAICRSKYRTRRALSLAGLRAPRFWLLSSPTEAEQLAAEADYPLVLKPPADSSSHGVRLVREPETLLAHYHEIASRRYNVRGQPLDRRVLAEELIEGPEYSVETLTVPARGTTVVGVADKHLSEPPHFVETGHDFPSSAGPRRQEELIEATRAALAAVGFDFGPAHTELRWTRRGPVVVEINPRLAGGMIPELVRQATGLDLIQAWLDLLAGRSVDLVPRSHGFASIRFLTAPAAGRLESVEGVEAARQLPGVRGVEVKARPGERVAPAVDAYGRLGWVIAAGPEPATARRRVERAAATIRLRIAPVAPFEEREELAV